MCEDKPQRPGTRSNIVNVPGTTSTNSVSVQLETPRHTGRLCEAGEGGGRDESREVCCHAAAATLQHRAHAEGDAKTRVCAKRYGTGRDGSQQQEVTLCSLELFKKKKNTLFPPITSESSCLRVSKQRIPQNFSDPEEPCYLNLNLFQNPLTSWTI